MLKNDNATSDGSTVCINVLANDNDPDGDVLHISNYTQPANGSVVIDPGTKKLCYTPNSGFEGTDSFQYCSCDPCGETSCATVTIIVELPNNPPVANNDEGTTEGDPVCIKVMTNDYDPDGDPIAVTNYGQPSQGTVTYNPLTKELCYDPKDDCYEGVVTFSYTICDNGSPKLCDDAVVTITVINDNIAPDAKNDALESDGSQVCKNVLSNDSDADGDVLSISMYGQGSNGVVIKAGSQLCYTPNAGFEGSDSFTYTVCDDCGLCDQATVTVMVVLPNNPPVANNDEGTTEGDPVCIKVMTNDYDPDGDPIAVTNYGQPSQGTVTYNPLTKELCYDPKDDCYEGVVTFSYTICDNGSPTLCDDAVVTITVINDNIAPDAKNDALESDGSQVCKNVLSNDSDADGDVLSISMYGQGSNGVVIKAGSQLCYTPNAGFEGSDSFTYTVCDDCGLCDQATVTVTVDIPCEPEVLEICADPLIPVTVCPQFCLEDWTIVEVEALFKCGIKLKEKCFIYTALPGQFGSDELIVKACDDFGNCETTIVYVIIGCGGNQPPFAQNDDVTTPQNQEGCLYPMNNDFDPDGDPITIEAISPPANGFIIYDDETGEFCYTPGLGFSGVEIFTYQVCDNKGACTSATITIVVTTDCEEDLFLCTKPLTPIIICPAFCTLNGEVQIIDAETTYNCSIKILPDGCVKYTSLPLFAGQETVTITGCDTNGNCETVTYIIEVSEDCDGEGFGLIPEHKDEIGSETSNKGQSGTPKMQINVSNYINGHVSIAYFVPTETVYRLAVTDMSGRLVYNTTVDASVSGWQPQMNLPTQHLSKGVYLVTITQDNDRANKVSAKFIAF
ncbi:MAG: tandem-95 repeat protein [Sphingobacteriales bacterium]|nr:tandem-95 repeat protein [Sphingobacteriales bacterium]